MSMNPIKIDSSYGVVIHRDFTPLFVDEKYASIFGFNSAQEVMELSSLFDIIDPKFHQMAQQSYCNVMSGKEQPKVRTYKNQNKQGHIFSVITVDHVIEWQGEPALQITVIDMSMLDKTNQRILEQEQKYKDLIWNSLQGIIVHRNFVPLMVNPSYVSAIGARSVAQIMAMGSLKCIIPEQNQHAAVDMHNQLISGKVKNNSCLVENICLDGKIRYFQLFESMIIWDGKPAVQSSLMDVTDRYLLEQKLEYQATHDDLTGLLNRRAITKKMLEICDKEEANVQSCLLIDIDNFKLINDQFGHFSGDYVIKEFAKLCLKIIKNNGFPGRWGGEEFIIMLPNITQNHAQEIAESIRRSCEKQQFILHNTLHTVTVSIGVSSSLNQKENVDTLIQVADNRMYIAKKEGKNQIFPPL